MSKAFVTFIFILSFFWFGCPKQPIMEKDPGLLYLRVINLGEELIKKSNLIEEIEVLPNRNYPSNKMMITRIDELSLGESYQGFDEYDIALENGFIKGLLSWNLQVVEKLDSLNIREFKEETPASAFYMHAIDLERHKTLIDTYGVSWLLQYQVIQFNKGENDIKEDDKTSVFRKKNLNPFAIVYFRLIDIQENKIISSTLSEVNNPDKKEKDKATVNMLGYYKKVNEAVSNFDFEKTSINLRDKFKRVAVLDIDILSVAGEYRKDFIPQKKLLAIENGLISGLIENSNLNYHNKPFLIEKTKGFLLKYPEVYHNTVFNINPILYEEWSEFVEQTGCTEVLMYRYVPNEGLYIRIIDANNNGEILFSNVIQFIQERKYHILNIHDTVARELNATFDFSILNDKKMMIINGNSHSAKLEEDSSKKKKLGIADLAIEEGIITSLVENSDTYSYNIYEKLKTLYLKQPWMYNDNIFNLNPLYLSNWKQLKDFGVDYILVYSNLISYEKPEQDEGYVKTEGYFSSLIEQKESNYDEIALVYRIIDTTTGEIVSIKEINSMSKMEDK